MSSHGKHLQVEKGKPHLLMLFPLLSAEADILIAACGRAEYVTGDWIKPGAAVIDVGINAVPDATKKTGYRLVGDVNFEQAAQKAGAITPVPGGVGPMTICMLLQNTLEGFKACLQGSNAN